jgi:hypothetical protein
VENNLKILGEPLAITTNFADPLIWSALQERFDKHHSDSEMSDIYDGEGYKRHSDFLSHLAHVSFLLNTDGVALPQWCTQTLINTHFNDSFMDTGGPLPQWYTQTLINTHFNDSFMDTGGPLPQWYTQTLINTHFNDSFM